MHLFHIYCKIKGWIHGDDTSYELIKMCKCMGRWMTKIRTPFYETFSPLFGRLEDMVISSLSLFFIMPL
jgi:hypothetical protein